MAFHEICIYKAKVEKQEEIEMLIKEVKEFYLRLDGLKANFRTNKQGVKYENFNDLKVDR